MKRAGVGIIGFGFMGKVHTYGYRVMPFFKEEMPLNPEIKAVCTAPDKTAEDARRLLPEADIYSDYQKIIERDDISIVHISTPNIYHKDALLKAMDAGKDIYCDKPITAHPDEAREVEKKLDSYNGIHRMVFNYRYFPAVMRARQLIEEGFLGELINFRGAYFHAGSVDPKRPLGWKERPETGGGIIRDMAPHILDMMRYLLGEYKAVLAETQILYPERPMKHNPEKTEKVEVEDHVFVLVRMISGGKGVMEASKIATGTTDELRFEIHGTKGALRFNCLQPNHLEAYNAQESEKPIGGIRGFKRIDTIHRFPDTNQFPGPKFSVGWIDSHMACLRSFFSCVAERRNESPGLEDGIRIQEILNACERSAKSGEWIDVS